jgi:hypothetical protein
VRYNYIKLPIKGDIMGINRRTRPLVGYGLDNALQSLAPQPIIAQRAPTTSDSAEIGTIWVYEPTNQAYILTSIVNALATWELISQGGSGTFCDLTVTGTCGATNIQGGAFGVTIDSNTGTAIDIGTTNAADIGIGAGGATAQEISILGGDTASAVLISADGAGDVTILTGATGTVNINGTGNTVANTLNLGTGAAAKTVALGSLNTTSSTAIQSGTGGISLSSGATTKGLIGVAPATPTAASPINTVTANSRVISATFTGFTTANGAYQTVTIVSSEILATSAIFATAYNLDNSGNHAAMQIAAMYIVAGTATLSLLNEGLGGAGGALGAGDNIFVNLWILN